MIPRSLVGRLTVLQVALAAAAVVVFAVSALLLAGRALELQQRTLLSNTARQLAAGLVQEWGEERDLPRAAQSLLAENAPVGVRVAVLDSSRQVVAVGGVEAGRDSSHVDLVTTPVPGGAWIKVSASSRPRERALSTLLVVFGLVALPLLLLLVVVSRKIALRLLAPLSRLAAEAGARDAPGRGSPFGSRTDPTEVRVVADAFERLVSRLGSMLRAEQRFAEDAAHELRTPLTVVTGQIERALGDPTLSPRTRESLRRGLDQANAMNQLVDALLLLRRADEEGRTPFDPQVPVNLCDLLREALDEALGRMPGRLADCRLEAPDEILVAGNATLIKAAIENLLSNALKFTRPGETVLARVEESGRRCHVIVEDAGPGIAPDDRERIFDAFYRGGEARAEQSGAGLGLPILRRVARAHRGDVLVAESSLGGARFMLDLPCWLHRA
ncbi:MAG: HAMP domain-containing sensor histidine kinase [Candidatus Eisenbacteria bacterium]